MRDYTHDQGKKIVVATSTSHIDDVHLPRPPPNPRRFEPSTSTTDVRSNAEKLEEAQAQIQQLQKELEISDKKLMAADEKITQTESRNRSLENAVKELEEALSSSTHSIQEKYNLQKAELQSVSRL